MRNRLFGKPCLAVFLALFCLLTSLNVHADLPVTSVFPETGQFKARLLRDANHLALMELSGSYDRDQAGGAINVEPRTVVANEFYRTHQDRYDFLVVFSTFEFDTGESLAFHLGVQNKVKGIGIAQYNNTASFGSQGKLQGYIDMAALSRYVSNPFDAGFDKVLQIFAHEFLHQWGANVRYRNSVGELRGDMLGKDDAHWSFLLSSGASVAYGKQWRDNGNGTFTSVAHGQFFSPLDLYLMGMYKKEEVPPFYLIENAAVERTRLPQNGVTISGVRRDLGVEDVIAAEGPRLPAAADAQKEFRLGFVLLSRPGAAPTDAQIAAAQNIRRAIATRMAILTGGRVLVHFYLEPKVQAGAGEGSTPGGTIRLALPTWEKGWRGCATNKPMPAHGATMRSPPRAILLSRLIPCATSMAPALPDAPRRWPGLPPNRSPTPITWRARYARCRGPVWWQPNRPPDCWPCKIAMVVGAWRRATRVILSIRRLPCKRCCHLKRR